MTYLIREDLQPLIKQTIKKDYPKDSLNAGLLIQRGLIAWADDDKEKKIKKELIDTITSIKPSELYQLAFDRWLLQTQQKDNFAVVPATIDGRLMTGLALGGTLETGVTTQHSYGMPMLAGSSVKGAVRAYAESLFSKKDADGKVILDEKGKTQIDNAMKPILATLFGADEDAEQANAGYLVWHDAWFIPALTKDGKYSTAEEAKPFVSDIVTVHHQKYYAGQLYEALDMESPIPNQQLAVQGSFYFVIEGANKQWLAFAKQLLENMLNEFGMGAKGTSGYGYFRTTGTLQTFTTSLKKRLVSLQSESVQDSNDPYAKLGLHISSMTEQDLIESLSKNLNKFLKSFDLVRENEEHCKAVAAITLAEHETVVKGWVGQSGNKEKAFKFVNKYKF